MAAEIKKVRETNLQFFRSVGSRRRRRRVNHPRFAWAARIVHASAYIRYTGQHRGGLFHEVVAGTKQLLACPMAHYVPSCTRINELPVHIAQRNAHKHDTHTQPVLNRPPRFSSRIYLPPSPLQAEIQFSLRFSPFLPCSVFLISFFFVPYLFLLVSSLDFL